MYGKFIYVTTFKYYKKITKISCEMKTSSIPKTTAQGFKMCQEFYNFDPSNPSSKSLPLIYTYSNSKMHMPQALYCSICKNTTLKTT